MRAVLADSGFLVALGIRRDPRHLAAKAFLARYKGEIIVPAPVVVESCYFLSTAAKIRLLEWVAEAPRKVAELSPDAYAEIRTVLARYAKLEPDFTDAAIVWLADKTGCRSIRPRNQRSFRTNNSEDVPGTYAHSCNVWRRENTRQGG